MPMKAIVVPALAALCWLALPCLAQAAEPESPRDGVGYVYLAPGIVSIPLGDDDFADLVDVGYEWGVGGGLMLSPGDKLGVGLGLGIHHAPLNLDEDVTNWCGPVDCDASFHLVRILPEIRIGGAFNRLFAYGYVAPGLVIASGKFSASAPGITVESEDTDAGFNLGLGGGVQVAVWQGLFVGGELGANLGFMGDPDDDEIAVGDAGDAYGAHMLNLRVMVGWAF